MIHTLLVNESCRSSPCFVKYTLHSDVVKKYRYKAMIRFTVENSSLDKYHSRC